jgi:SAM-dependent methyltransferase
MREPRRLLKAAIGSLYSMVADNLYDPIVVRGTFRLAGGDLNSLVFEQGRRAVRVASGRDILDMPVGTAYFTTSMARGSPGIVVGADVAWGMVRHARRAAARSGTLNLVAVQADAHHLPFTTGSFGAVLCSNGLQVIPGLRPAVAELARVLGPQGALFVSVVTAPLGAVLPHGAAQRLPAILRSGDGLAEAIADTGLEITSLRRDRLAYLIEARKPG